MDYSCAKFGDFSFSRFGFIVRTNTDTDATKCFTPETVVGVSNNYTRDQIRFNCYNCVQAAKAVQIQW